MIDRIVNIIGGIVLNVPIILLFPYMMKFIIASKKNDNLGKFIVKLIAVLTGIIIALFLMFIICVRFILVDYEIPKIVSILGMILFPLYFLGISSLVYGLGTLGHGGVSPGKVLRELYNDLFGK